MAQINLLPWREERRLQLNQNFYVATLLFALVGFALVFLVDMQISQQVSFQETRNKYIRNEQKKLEAQIKEIEALKQDRERLEARMKVIQDLQGNRSIIVHYFSEITRAVPDGVYLTKVQRKRSEFNIEGVAEANNRVSNFMRLLDNSEWFSKPALTSVIANEEDGSNVFVLNVNARTHQGEQADRDS